MRTNTHTRQHRLTRPLGSGPANWEYWLERFYCSSLTSRAETQLGVCHFEPVSAPRTVDWKHPHRIPKPDEDAYLRRFSTAHRRPGPWPPLPPYSDEPNALSVAAALQRADERLNERLGLWGKIRDWSQTTFGDGRRTQGLLEHIRRELDEVAAKPDDLVEWVDVVLLAFDGYWRHGGKPEEFLDAVRAKYEVNQARKWPPPAPEDQPNHHVKETPAPQAATTLDAVYTERNRLALVVARLAKAAGLPVACVPDPENGPDWRVLYVQFPGGQASWHIPVKDLTPLLPPPSNVKWDGHTKAQAYDRMEMWAASVELVGPEELFLLREIANAAWRWMRTESSSRPGFVEDALMHAVNALVSYGKQQKGLQK